MRKGYVFTGVCHSVQGGCILACPGADTLRQTPPLGRHTPPPDGHCSGRYASYWNAFLFSIQKQSRRFLARLKILYEEFRAHRFRPCRSQDITVAPLGDYLLLHILTWAGGIQSPLKLWGTLAFLSSLIYNYQDLDHRPTFT